MYWHLGTATLDYVIQSFVYLNDENFQVEIIGGSSRASKFFFNEFLLLSFALWHQSSEEYYGVRLSSGLVVSGSDWVQVLDTQAYQLCGLEQVI